MTGETVALISTIVGIVSGIGGFIISYLTRQGKKAEANRNEGQRDGTINSDLGYIKAGVDDLKRDNRELNKALSTLSERVTRVEESAKEAHHRITELNDRLN